MSHSLLGYQPHPFNRKRMLFPDQRAPVGHPSTEPPFWGCLESGSRIPLTLRFFSLQRRNQSYSGDVILGWQED